METHDPFFAHPYDGTAVARVENPNPPTSEAASMLGLYHQEVRHWDGLLGEHLAWMKKSGLYDRALIIVTSDHGEEFGDHGHFWHGTSLYRELIRVPLIIRFPNGAGAGTRRGETVSLVDVMPTSLQAAGIPPPAGLSGRALAAVPVSPTVAPEPEPAADPSKGTKVDGTKAASASTSVVTLAPAAVPERVLFAELDHQGCVLRAVRKGVYKLVLANPDNPRGSAEVELYRLDRDPKERSNLAETSAPIVESMRSLFMAEPNKATAEPVEPEQVDVDAATEEQLRALGYTQ
jgi:arylsulfatase A-like enzyme